MTALKIIALIIAVLAGLFFTGACVGNLLAKSQSDSCNLKDKNE